MAGRRAWLAACVALAQPTAGVFAQTERNNPGEIDIRGQLAPIIKECDATPRLRAMSGGGVQELTVGKTIRIPYGVPYQFRHDVGKSTDFVLITFKINNSVQTSEALPLSTNSTCYTLAIPPLPMNQPITLIEQRGVFPEADKKNEMRAALDELRRKFIERLYSDVYNDRIVKHEMREAIEADLPQLLDTAELSGFVVRNGVELSPLPALIARRFSSAAISLAGVPARVVELSALPGRLKQAAALCADATPEEKVRIASFADRIAELDSITRPQQIAALYKEGGLLPVRESELSAARAAVAHACARHPQSATFAKSFSYLADDPLIPVIDALSAARFLIEQSFAISATDIFPGATTTLQRYGQVDVVNAFFWGSDEVRLLATFSFYPGQLRYGGELQPNGPKDAVVLTAGYSLGTVVSDSSNAVKDRTVFTVGVGYRLNEFLSLGVGQWFDGRAHEFKKHFYVSVAGDIGGIPFLRELLARKPEGD